MNLKDIFYISENNWYKLQAWAKLAYDEDKNEISGLMTAVPQEDGRFELKDVEILKQQNTGTNTELDKDSVTEYLMKYGMKYKDPAMKFVWWHSHHTMGAFWSGTDEKEIDAWKNNSFSLALVINLREEYKFRVSMWNLNGLPLEEHYDTNLTIERKNNPIQITKTMKKKYEDYCSTPVVHQRINSNSYMHYNRGSITHNVNQKHLWERETNLIREHEYSQALQEATSMQDSLIDGTLKIKDYKQKIKRFNKICKDSKLPFKHIIFKENNAHKLCAKLMHLMPEDLFEWENNDIKEAYEQNEIDNWNQSWGIN